MRILHSPAVIFFAYMSMNLAKAVDVPDACLLSLEHAERVVQNCEFEFRKLSNSQISATGKIRIRDDMINCEFQYADETKVVFVWRKDATFQLEEAENAWIPRMLNPGSSEREFRGPGSPVAHLYFAGTRLVDILRNKSDSYNLIAFGQQSKGATLWEVTIGRRKSKERWLLTLDESKHWLPIRLNYAKAVIEYSYERSLNDVPILSKLVETNNSKQTGEVQLDLISEAKPSDQFFRLPHYGLSEGLLLAQKRNDISGWGWPITFIAVGITLIAVSIWMRR